MGTEEKAHRLAVREKYAKLTQEQREREQDAEYDNRCRMRDKWQPRPRSEKDEE